MSAVFFFKFWSSKPRIQIHLKCWIRSTAYAKSCRKFLVICLNNFFSCKLTRSGSVLRKEAETPDDECRSWVKVWPVLVCWQDGSGDSSFWSLISSPVVDFRKKIKGRLTRCQIKLYHWRCTVLVLPIPQFCIAADPGYFYRIQDLRYLSRIQDPDPHQ